MFQEITPDNFNQMLGRFTTTDLEVLLAKSPYFQQAHLLLAKKYQQENNPKFDQQLQLAALYTQDRELLFKIFHELPAFETVFIKPAEEQVIAEPKFTPPLVIETETEEILVKEEEPLSITEVLELPKPQIEDVELKNSEVAATTEVSAEIIAPQFSKSDSHLFADWLKAFNKAPVIAPKEAEKTNEEIDEELNRMIMQNTPVEYLHDKMKEETQYSKGLDKFISEQIEKHKVDYVKPAVDNGIDPELITETMAKVYEMQKKYQKAIKAYEILALKNPEKNDFFAARINYLKNII